MHADGPLWSYPPQWPPLPFFLLDLSSCLAPYFNVSFSSILTFTKPTNVKGNTSKEENAHLRLFLDVLKIVPFWATECDMIVTEISSREIAKEQNASSV